MTPAELNFVIEAHTEVEKRQFKNNLTVAYYNAIFQRAKNIPKLESILNSVDGDKEKTDNDMFDIVQKLHKQLGGE